MALFSPLSMLEMLRCLSGVLESHRVRGLGHPGAGVEGQPNAGLNAKYVLGGNGIGSECEARVAWGMARMRSF